MIRGTRESLVALVVQGGGRALFLALVSNLYGAHVLGVVALATTVMVLFALVFGVSSDFSAAVMAGQHPERAHVLRFNALLYSGLVLLLSSPASMLLYATFGSSIFADYGVVARVALPVMAAAQAAQLQIQGIHVGLGNFRKVTAGHAIHYAGLLTGAYLVWAVGLDGESLLPLYALMLVIKAGYQAAALPRVGDGSAPTSLRVFRSQLHEGLHMMLGSLANLLNYRLDALFIAYFMPTFQVGIYAAAAAVAEATLYVPRGVGQAALSWASSTSDGDERGRGWWGQVRSLFVGVGLAGLVVVGGLSLLLSGIMPWVFGAEFDAAVPPARLLLVAALFNGLGLLAMNVLYGTGHARLNTRAGGLAVALNAVGNVFLTPRFGLLGAASASLVSYTVYGGLAMGTLWHVASRGPVKE